MEARPASTAPVRWWAALWRRWRGGVDPAEDVRGLPEERAALEAALRLKRRHDEERHAELDELRALRLRQQGERAGEQRGAAPSGQGGDEAWAVPAAPRARTAEQIERIAAQMAEQLTAPAPPDAAADGGAPRRGRPRLAIDLVHAEPHAAVEPQGWLGHPALTEAAVAYANGRFDAARRSLEALEADARQPALACVAGRLRLDLLWALGDLPGFEAAAADWAERFGRPPPVWPVQHAETAAPARPVPQRIWRAPARLSASALTGWDGASEPDALDWRGLEAVEDDALAPLTEALERWAAQPRVLSMAGVEVLLRVLKAATPSGRRDVAVGWWRLRLAALRLLERRAAYELAALDALASVGLAPVPWSVPRARVVEVDELPAEAPSPAAPQGTELAGESQFPAMPTALADWPAEAPAARGASASVIVEGVLAGDVGSTLARLEEAWLRLQDADGGGMPLLVIDAQGLQRLDFAAAGALLQWLLAARARGLRVQWHGVAPLIGLLLHAVGIDEVAEVRLRQ